MKIHHKMYDTPYQETLTLCNRPIETPQRRLPLVSDYGDVPNATCDDCPLYERRVEDWTPWGTCGLSRPTRVQPC